MALHPLRCLLAAAVLGLGAVDASAQDQARGAESRLAGDQKPEGCWLTGFTPSVRFDQPSFEINTFLTAMTVMLLSPMADEDGVHAMLTRARSFAASQIEPNGLVRYYGRMDGPRTRWSGGPIVPDADDTALAWTVAGGEASQARRAVTALDSFRTPEGTYRTWLGNAGELVGVNPGADPNPPDIGIQLDVLAFLAKYDPPRARRLCSVLEPLVAEPRLWVYYRRAPLIPILCLSELRRAGYRLPQADEAQGYAVPGQETWVRACELIARYISGSGQKPSAEESDRLLARLAENDFSEIRHNPPLLYHNDLSASVGRYYWSEDFGYAIWLRLSHEKTLALSVGAGLK